MNNTLGILFLLFSPFVFAQDFLTPAQKKNYSKPTTYDELSEYVQLVNKKSPFTEVEILGKSTQNRNLYALKFSNSGFGTSSSKIKILIFAQQHGNEQSGKEGALLLVSELQKPENARLFDRIDLAIIPLMNPDGSEDNKRRNGNGVDLNRNHLILTEPETIALHRFFDKYLFEVSMDVHEYFPYGDTWRDYGYRNNSDILLGSNTNINIPSELRDFSNNSCIPFIRSFLENKGISNFLYSPGGPPEIEYIRHSTFDINDGRQSFGIQNTLSFIQEGLNGKDSFTENLQHRAFSQMSGMMGLLWFSYNNYKQIMTLVHKERENLESGKFHTGVAIQYEHVKNGKKLQLPVYSYFSGNDTIINVTDYRPLVSSIFDVSKPSAYLVPKAIPELTAWLDRQSVYYTPYKPSGRDIIEQYFIEKIDSIDFEGDVVINPEISEKEIKKVEPSDYFYIPLSQLKVNILVIALEPKSMLGLSTYPSFAHLIKADEPYPVLRLEKKRSNNFKK